VCEELLSAHLDALYRTALRLCGGRAADAEDVLQETALRALQGFPSLRDLQAGRAWLFTILVRTFRNRVRTVERRAETLAADLDEEAFEDALAAWRPAPTLEELVANQRLRERLTVALDALDVPMRVVLWLVDIEGFRQREVAEMLEIPEGTVASRLYRAHQRLRETWTEAGRRRRKLGEV
jgi:RNA polymerase sigma-70 factor (ECF subfamily)